MAERALATVAVDRGLIGGPFGSSLVGKDYVDLGVPVIRGANLGVGSQVGGDFAYVSEAKVVADLSRNTARPGDLVFTQRGTLGQVAVVPTGDYSEYVISQSQMRLRVDEAVANARFIYFACTAPAFLKQIGDNAISTGVPHINLGILGRLTIPDLPLGDQQAIAEVLGALDDKIAANGSLIRAILGHLAALYEAAVSGGVRTMRVNDLAQFHNRRRIPLSAKQREERRGKVPYYGATGVFGYVDEAIFDENLVLIGEDGSVVQPDGRPVVQYIWGPAWVNNHAHVLTGVGISTELLRFALSRANVAPIVTGAVQLKISMGNLKALELEVPRPSTLSALEESTATESAVLRAIDEETRSLTTVRDALLPLLMSGKVRVKDAERVVGEVV